MALCAIVQKGDLQKENIKGRVISVTETEYKFESKFGENIKLNTDKGTQTFYDEYGNIFKIITNDDAKSQIEELASSGFLNGSDILFLKELSNDLIKLDLSDVQIVEGGETYAIVTEKYYTRRDEISDYNLCETRAYSQVLRLPY